ncbi:START domain-containing protein [Mucilaginibacter sp.]|uniref:START domain-containing protein n=1 Tax=Mucilaginibacter sp. TaxID=1882438 RepID=UPI0025D45981|nr:START domain-containing protein [Mucilaginibacter sp.]
MEKFIYISFLLILKLSLAFGQSDWKLSTEKEEIRVYTSIVPDSKIKAVRVECDLKATASQLVALLMDVKTSPDWEYHTKSCVLLKQVSSTELYYYSEISLPWPAENRDFVAHLIITQNPDTKVVTVEGPAVPGFVPVKKGIVRVVNSSGKWIITPAGADQLKVEYTIHVDPGGSVPAWLVNMFATEGPLKFFKSLKIQLRKPAYQNVVIASIEN